MNNTPPRQKACRACVTAKARCDTGRPACRRCRDRAIGCEYVSDPSSSTGPSTRSSSRLHRSTEPSSLSPSQTPTVLTWPDLAALRRSENGASDFRRQEMRAPLLMLSEERRQTLLGNQSGILHAHSLLARKNMHFIVGVLKSWPRMMAMHHTSLLPPIIHRAQIEDCPMPPPLANCYTLVKMWSQQADGSRELVDRMLLQEVHRLMIKVNSFLESFIISLTKTSTLHIMSQISWPPPNRFSCCLSSFSSAHPRAPS